MLAPSHPDRAGGGAGQKPGPLVSKEQRKVERRSRMDGWKKKPRDAIQLLKMVLLS